MTSTSRIASFEFPLLSWDAAKELIDITGAGNLTKLVQDSLRSNEWIVFWQSKKRTIAALSDEQLAILAECGCGVKDDARIVNYIQQGKEEQAFAYFKKAKAT